MGSPKSSATTTYNSTTATNRQTDGQMDFTTEQSLQHYIKLYTIFCHLLPVSCKWSISFLLCFLVLILEGTNKIKKYFYILLQIKVKSNVFVVAFIWVVVDVDRCIDETPVSLFSEGFSLIFSFYSLLSLLLLKLKISALSLSNRINNKA